ncbi:nucleoside diphosphate kinase regulator [Arenimonas composti]|uniref:Nucleoside diphosphate kinase regulator n=1 Tax=Arenimonas composti TR7-09 = DSM 18010 TaxID=1121013 RepID=A0A091BBA9_9GAMM|nr:nucleoside diphosphate kinase regulator [Arenimonas composti]KFN48802.1 hypothetical protein P873_13400 [Arenimonas composti TR7-09 = DSM 18010]
MSTLPPIILSTRDLPRLESMLENATGPVAEALEAELVRADVRTPDALPADVVTMNSQVVCVDDAGNSQTVRLVFPNEADAATGKVSVLAPVGAALLGLTAGQAIEWPLPGGRTTRMRVEKVLYQPEAAGEPG